MIKMSESIKNIAPALVAFQEDVKRIDKDGVNPHFRSTYTTLDNMIDETKPILQKHGLTVMQFPGGDGERVTIRTLILHQSGEWIESEPLTLRPTKQDPQGIGSAITYGRRYSYAAALSLALGDDDDGNAASAPVNKDPESPPATLKAKYQTGKGSMDGFDEWVRDMKAKGLNYKAMEEVLAKALNKKVKQKEEKANA